MNIFTFSEFRKRESSTVDSDHLRICAIEQTRKESRADRVEWVNAAQTEAEIEALRKCVHRIMPSGLATKKITSRASRVRLAKLY